MVHYTSACAAGGGGGAKPSQSWFYIPLGLLCATIAAASGGLGDNLVRLSYIRAERRKEEREGEADSLSPLERGAASARERVEKGGGSDSEEDMMDFPIAGEEGDASPMRDRRPTLVVRIVGGPGGSRCPRIAAALPAELMRPYWVAGWSLTTFINSGGVVLAMGLAPASMIIPFAAVHIAFAVTFARVVNKEPCTVVKAIGCMFIMVGILIVLITDGLVPHQDVTDLAQLKNDLKNTPFLVLTGLILALIGAALASYLTRKIHKRKNIAQLGIAVTAGSFGALSNVLGKSAIEIVKEVMCSGNWSLLADVFAYVIIGSMIVTLICQVCSLNTGLSNYETMVITSSTNATLTIVGTIESIVYFEEYTEWEWFTWCLMPAGVFVAAVGLLLLAGILDPCVATIHAAISRDIIAPLRETAMDNSGGETVWAKMLEWADYHEAESLEALKQEKGARASTDGASGSCDERLDQPLLFSPISTSDATGAFDDGGGASMMSGGVKSTRMVQKNRSDDGVVGRRAEPPQDNGSGARGSIGRGSRSAVRVGSDFKSGEGGEGGGGGGSPALSDDFRRGSGSGTHLDRGRDDGRNYEDEKSPTWAENETGAGVQPARNGRGEPTAAGGRVSELAARSSSGSGSPRSYDGSDMLEAAATGSSSGANSPRPGGYISPSVRSPSWKSRGGPPVEDVDFL